MLGTFDLSGIPPAPRGVPKIKVTFDMDENGILNVSAKDISSGRTQNITIKNDKGRLSQEDIDRMVSEAEQYREEYDKQKERISARNQLEGYIVSLKQAIDEVRNQCDGCLRWLDGNSLAEKEEYEAQQKQLTSACSPIMVKLHEGNRTSQQMPGSCGQETGGFGNTPRGSTVEEVD